jgi:hypothetical protein
VNRWGESSFVVHHLFSKDGVSVRRVRDACLDGTRPPPPRTTSVATASSRSRELPFGSQDRGCCHVNSWTPLIEQRPGPAAPAWSGHGPFRGGIPE